MVKGIKRVFKHLRTACHESRRHRRLSDHRAVALGVHYTVTGLFKSSRLTGTHAAIAALPEAAGSASPPFQGEGQGGDGSTPTTDDLDRQAARIQAAGDSGAAFFVSRRGKVAFFDRPIASC